MSTPYDYEASKRKLSDKLRQMRESSYSPTPEARNLRKLAEHLEKTADMLTGSEWWQLESVFDSDPIQTDLDGWPTEPEERRAGRFKATKWRLREIASVAREQASALPNSRQDPVLPYGAAVLLHLMYNCDRPTPTMYDDGGAVIEFEDVCKAAGIYLSRTRLRGPLSDAWKEFDGSSCPPGFEYILTYRE